MPHPARAFDFRDVLSLTIAVASAIASPASDSTGMPMRCSPTLSSAAWSVRQQPSPSHSSPQAISASSIFQHSPQCPEDDFSVLGIVCIFLVTVLLKAGGDIFHALIMGAYIYIPVYVPYLAMASGLIPGTRSKGWTGSPRYECRRAKRRQERQLLQQIQAMRSAKGCRLLSSLSMRLNTRYHLHAIAFLHLL